MTRAQHPGEEELPLAPELEEVLEAAWVADESSEEETAMRAEHFQRAVKAENVAELRSRGLLEDDPSGRISLTALGRKKAERIIRAHRLAERLVCDVLHSDLATAEDSACVFEHVVAPDIADAICTLLGHPTTCPHGRPIPPADCCHRNATEVSSVIVRLPRLKVGQRALIAYVEAESSPRMQKLLALGIAPGRTLEILQRWPVIIVRVDNTQIAIDQPVAESISVYAPA
jgi:DtxR family transcriptional regulator, Mn-dependent transcriptional regulator